MIPTVSTLDGVNCIYTYILYYTLLGKTCRLLTYIWLIFVLIHNHIHIHIISWGREGGKGNKRKTYTSNRTSTNCRLSQVQQDQSSRDYKVAHKHVNKVIITYAHREYEFDLQIIDQLADQTVCMPRVTFTTRCTSTVTKLSWKSTREQSATPNPEAVQHNTKQRENRQIHHSSATSRLWRRQRHRGVHQVPHHISSCIH